MNHFSIITLFVFSLLSASTGQTEKQAPQAPGFTPSTIVKKIITERKNTREPKAIIAPDFTLKKVNGKLFRLSDLKGKVVLMNFWGTWCGPCRAEIPDLNSLYAEHKNEGLEIVGITLTSGTEADIAKFMKEWKMEYTVLTDVKGNETMEVTSLYGKAIGQPINGLPTTLIINREGQIVKGYIGARTKEIFYKDLKPYLQ
ncbi:MAG: TlpA disulfide reductase family protein [Fidelibacterota bacterium]